MVLTALVSSRCPLPAIEQSSCGGINFSRCLVRPSLRLCSADWSGFRLRSLGAPAGLSLSFSLSKVSTPFVPEASTFLAAEII